MVYTTIKPQKLTSANFALGRRYVYLVVIFYGMLYVYNLWNFLCVVLDIAWCVCYLYYVILFSYVYYA